MSYQGLILDFGGVVTTSLFDELSAFCVREGLAPDAFARALHDGGEGQHAFEAVEAGKIPQREYEVTIGRILGVSDSHLLIRALGGLQSRLAVLDLVGRARVAGIRAGCLSNSWGDGEFDPYDGWDLGALFDAVVISGDTGTRKPDPAIYQLTADKLGVPPTECVFRRRHGRQPARGASARDGDCALHQRDDRDRGDQPPCRPSLPRICRKDRSGRRALASPTAG
jgi:putative hydrolase of the HAD superfamily